MTQHPDPHRDHRFPAEIIAHAVWLCHVFSLSLRDVELRLAERGVTVSCESIRRWCLKFARSFAHKLRHRLTDNDEVAYETTRKGEPFKGTEVSRKSVAAYVVKILEDPSFGTRSNVGISKTGTDGDKPASL